MRRPLSFPVPEGHCTAQQIADRLGVSNGAVRHAYAIGKIDGVRIDDFIFIKDADDAILRTAFPRLFDEDETTLLERWMNTHDIRSIGERAVKETA